MTMTTADLPAVAAVADDGAVSPRAARPRRRSFTAVYKLRTLAEYKAAQPGERTNRPCAMGDVYAAYQAELGAQRQAEAPAQRAAAIQAREVGRPALHGDAHQQVRNILAHRARVAAAGKAKQVRAENAAYAEFIAWARGR